MKKTVVIVVLGIGLGLSLIFGLSGKKDTHSESKPTDNITHTSGQIPTLSSPDQPALPSALTPPPENSDAHIQLSCSEQCKATLEALNFVADIDDSHFETILANAEEIAAALSQNDDARADMITLAANTDDGNKRKIIMAAFRYLPQSDQELLGLTLTDSLDATQRKSGVDFLASFGAEQPSLVGKLTSLLETEGDEYVRDSLIKALNQPEHLKGDQQVLDVLYDVVRSDPDPNVRGEALIASVDLLNDPEDILPDTLSAIQSSDDDYQFYGLRSLELILSKETVDPSSTSWSRQQALTALDEILAPDNSEGASEATLSLADELYERLFGGS